MTFQTTAIEGVLIAEPRVFSDHRGQFFESHNQRRFDDVVPGGRAFVQDNHSISGRHVLRGLHYQITSPQGKLVRVTAGEIFDVTVDLRRSSPTFGKWAGFTLSADNRKQLWIPEGLAHGFVVLSETAEVLYKATDYYAPAAERTLQWDDPDLGIDWPVRSVILSDKDAVGTPFRDAELFP
jgi:dTDP-4-dehydrorhamnose 3,5-epimerase